MQELDIKRGHFSLITEGRLKALMIENFGDVTEEGEVLISNYKALAPIKVWIKDKKTLCINIETDPGVGDEVALESIRAKNKFLQAATGFNSKERSKRIQKKAKEGKL
jgi:hypothetical protein